VLIQGRRNHRDRKVTYIKDLEQEVSNLRARNGVAEAQTIDAREVIRQLHDLIHANGLVIPPYLQIRMDLHVRTARAQLVGETVYGQRLQVQLPTTASSTTSSNACIPSTSNGIAPAVPSNSPNAAPSRDCGLDHASVQLGVDFVLTLEHVCLHHHGLVSDEPVEQCSKGADFHAALLQSQVMHRADPAELHPLPSGLPSQAAWDVPAVELERLLSLSQQLGLTNEITPVQAWQQLVSHPKYAQVTREKIEALCQQLLLNVRCQG
jgi:hypothetical protein